MNFTNTQNNEIIKVEVFENEQECTSIHHLPQEVLEYIFSMVSPYRDFKSIMLTCSWWRNIMKNVAQRYHASFIKCIKEGEILWEEIKNAENNTIIERYSHCAAYLGCSLYIFGGCTSSNTTFNDLWRFDLASRQWIRPLATGNYPSPKACATMVAYKETLILFGGYTHPTPYPLHQAARFFNQLHVYDPATNRWAHLNTIGYSPPPVAGHSASIIGNRMIIFGGSHGLGSRTNEVWVLDLEEAAWSRVEIGGCQPSARYGQTQIVVDDDHILIIGGCGGANTLYSDVWLLDMSNMNNWFWSEVIVQDIDAPTALQLWCHPASKVSNSIVILGRSTEPALFNQTLKTATSTGQPRLASLQSQPAPIPHLSYLQPHLPHTHDTNGYTDHHPSSSNVTEAPYYRSSNPSLSVACGLPRRALIREPYLNRESSHQHRQSTNSCKDSSSDESSYELTRRVDGVALRNNERTETGNECSNNLKSQPEFLSLSHRLGPSIRPNAHKDRQKQLEALQRAEQRIRRLTSGPQGVSSSAGPSNRSNNSEVLGASFSAVKASLPAGIGHNQPPLEQQGMLQQNLSPGLTRSIRNKLKLHILDLSSVVSGKKAKWLTLNDNVLDFAPEETVFYTISEGRGELILFGGLLGGCGIGMSPQRPPGPSKENLQTVSNKLWIMSAKTKLI